MKTSDHSAQAFALQDFLPYLLNQAAEVSSLDFQSYYKSTYGMLRTEWRVLAHLGRYGEMAAKDLCRVARIHKTKVSRAVAALEVKRFLTRSTVETDRRQELLSLTKAGQKAYMDLSAAALRFDQDLTAELTEEEARVLKQVLRRIARM